MIACILAAAAFMMVVFTVPEPAAAQVWSLDTSVGQANYKTAPVSIFSTTAMLGLRFNQDRRLFQGTLGLPLKENDVTWGFLGLSDRLAVRNGAFDVGADVSAFANLQHDPLADTSGGGLLLELLPVISHSNGARTLEARSGVRWYGSRLGDADWTRGIWTTDFHGGMQASETVRLGANVRHDHAGENDNYTRARFSLTVAAGSASLQAGVGGWIHGVPGTKPEWDASFAIPVRRGVWFFAAAEYEDFNPQFFGPARTVWSAGVTFQIGGASEVPEPSGGVEIEEQGRTVIRVPATVASTTLSIAGDFTGWMPVPMTRQGSDWVYESALPSGVYHFAFRTAEGQWTVPENIASRQPDGMGGWVGVLVIP